MTGYHMGHAYIRGNHDENGSDMALRPQDTTFLEILQKNGYHVACVGEEAASRGDCLSSVKQKHPDSYFRKVGPG